MDREVAAICGPQGREALQPGRENCPSDPAAGILVAMATIDLTVPDELKAFLDAEAAGGGYSTSSDYIRDVLLAIWREKSKSALESELVRRIEGEPAVELPQGFWDDLKARVRRRQVSPR